MNNVLVLLVVLCALFSNVAFSAPPDHGTFPVIPPEVSSTPNPYPHSTTVSTTTQKPSTTTVPTTSTTPPSTTTNSTTTTTGPTSTTTKAPTTSTPTTSTTSEPPHSTPAPSGGSSGSKFDAASFIGGFILASGLMVIAFISWKFYMSRQDNFYHTL